MIEVKVHPKARQEKIEKRSDNLYEAWTFSPPDKGAANAAVTKLLAQALGVAPGRVILKRGATSRVKFFEID